MSTDSDYEDEDFVQAVIVDNGSYNIKAGFAYDDAPRAVFPAIVGRPRRPSVMVGMAQKDAYVGDEAQSKRGILCLQYPIKNGVVRDSQWHNMEKIFHHTFYNELRIQPEEHHVLLTEPPLNPKSNREKMTEIIFEKFNVPGMYLSMTSLLSLYASGRCNGIVVESGASTFCVPIYEGYALRDAITTLNIGGQDITNYLYQLMHKKGYCDIKERDGYCKIKETMCFIANDYEAQQQKTNELLYTLPDGQCISIDSERFTCSEILFQPHLVGIETDGIHKLLYSSMLNTEVDFNNLCNNIVLSGGNTMFPGFAHRLRNELEKIFHSRDDILLDGYLRYNYHKSLYSDIVNTIYRHLPIWPKVKVIAPPERKYSVWIGGSIIASTRSFENSCVSKDEYDESGTRIVHRKCF